MAKRISHLDQQIVVHMYEELKAKSKTGRVNSAQIYRGLAALYLNAETGQPFTRQLVHRLLNQTLQIEYPPATRQRPIVILDPHFPLVSDWLMKRYPLAEVVEYRWVVPEQVRGRHVYGHAPLACMLAAKFVWWIFIDSFPLLYDLNPDELEELADRVWLDKLQCKRVF